MQSRLNYESTSAASAEYGETNDCAVRAVAIVTGLDYGVVWHAFRAAGRVRGGATLNCVIRSVVANLGYDMDAMDVQTRSVRSIPADPALAIGRYLVFVSGHVMAVIDGQARDWMAGSRKHIRVVYRITG